MDNNAYKALNEGVSPEYYLYPAGSQSGIGSGMSWKAFRVETSDFRRKPVTVPFFF